MSENKKTIKKDVMKLWNFVAIAIVADFNGNLNNKDRKGKKKEFEKLVTDTIASYTV